MVFRAKDLERNQTVALKVLPAGILSSGSIERFQRECRTLSMLSHPAIVSYIAHGEVQPGQPFLAMKWLDGESLAHRLARQPLVLSEALTLLTRLASALAEAHQAGIVHRDIKPSNIILLNGQIESATVIDFGIASGSLGRAVYRLTHSGALLGSPDYLSPEQARGHLVQNPSADIFSLGCVIYECLVGRTPFAGEHMAALLAKILFEDPTPLAQHVSVPDWLDSLVMRMLHKDPAQRPIDAAALLAELTQQRNSNTSKESPPKEQERGLTTDEQRLVSVILATRSVAANDTSEQATDDSCSELRETLKTWGVQSDMLADGTFLATLIQRASSSATEQAESAARCALLVHRHLPSSRVALATGLTEIAQRPRTGETAERAWRLANAQLLHPKRALAQQDAEPQPVEQVVSAQDSFVQGVLCDESTALLIEARFAISRSGEQVFLLTGERQHEAGPSLLVGRQLSFRGRDMELASLEVALTACVEGPQPRAVLITAPPGVGKSRLQREFVQRLSTSHPDICVLQGRADLVSAGSAYAALSRALRRLGQLSSSQSVEEQRSQLVSRLGLHLPAHQRERIVEFLGELCSIDLCTDPSPKLRAARSDPKIMSTQVCQAWVDFLWAETAQHPVLLVLEDLHWGDSLTATLVDSALRELVDRPFMVLALARPEMEDILPKLWNERGVHHIRLGPLSRRICESLAREVLGTSVSEPSIRRAAALSGGNALCLEESIRAVAEGHGDEPSTAVMAMLQARLLRLSADTRRVLRAASIFGEVFWRDGLRELLGTEPSEHLLDQELRKLIAAELVESSVSDIPSRGSEFQFRHALMRDAAYSLLTIEDRTLGHRLAGRYLEAHGERDPILLAEHFHKGKELPSAARHLLRAAERALAVSHFDQALRFADAAVRSEPSGDVLGNLRAVQLAAHFWQDDWAAALPAGQEALALLPVGSEDWCKAVALLLPISSITGNLALFAEISGTLASVDPLVGAQAEYIRAAAYVVVTLSLSGDKQTSERFLRITSKIEATLPHNEKAQRGLLRFAQTVFSRTFGRDVWANQQIALDGVLLSEAAGDNRNLLFIKAFYGTAAAELGEPSKADQVLRDSMTLARDQHEPLLISHASLMFEQMQLELGHTIPLSRLMSAQIASDPNTNPLLRGQATANVARAYLYLGQISEAESHARKALAALCHAPAYWLIALPTLIWSLVRQMRITEACQLAEQGLAMIDSYGGGGVAEISIRLAAAEAYYGVRNPTAAREQLRRARAEISLRAASIPDPQQRTLYLNQSPQSRRVDELIRRFTTTGDGL